MYTHFHFETIRENDYRNASSTYILYHFLVYFANFEIVLVFDEDRVQCITRLCLHCCNYLQYTLQSSVAHLHWFRLQMLRKIMIILVGYVVHSYDLNIIQ